MGDKVKKCKFVFDLDATVLQVIEVNVEKTLELLNRKFGNEFVIENSLVGFELNKPSIRLNTFEWLSSDTITINETWKPIWGEVSEIRNHYKTSSAPQINFKCSARFRISGF